MSDNMLIQFVSSMDASAVVRHDANASDSVYVNAEGISLGSPAKQGDPDAFNPEWRFRQIQFEQVVEDYKNESFAALASLEQECLRGGYVRLQASPGRRAAYAKVYPTPISPVSWDRFFSASDDSIDIWTVPVTLDADAWLYGEKEQITVEVASTIDAGTNRQQIVLPEIMGDVGTPVTITFPTGPVPEAVSGPWMVSLAPQGDATLNRWAVTAQAGTTSLANAPAAIAPGRYKLIAFLPSGSPTVRFGWSPDGTNTLWNADGEVLPYLPLATPGGAAISVQDLGEVQFTGAPGSGDPFIPKIQLQRLSGSGTINLTLMLVTISDDRIDEDGAVATPTPAAGVTAQTRLWLGDDGVQAQVYTSGGQTFSTGVVPDGATTFMAYPQHQNILTLLPAIATATYTVTITYRPRYRQIPGD